MQNNGLYESIVANMQITDIYESHGHSNQETPFKQDVLLFLYFKSGLKDWLLAEL